MVIFRYFKELFSLWTAIVFTIVDIIAFAITLIEKDITVPVWIYWAIAVTGFVVANIQLYSQQEKKINGFEKDEADLLLTVHDPIIEIRKITYEDSFGTKLKPHELINEQGMPYPVFIVANVEIENLGKEKGVLEWEISADFGQVFELSEEEKDGEFVDFANEVDGRERFIGKWELWLYPHVQNVSGFAEILSTAEKYKVTIKYWTKRIGEKSKTKTVVISGTFTNFVNEVNYLWKKGGWI